MAPPALRARGLPAAFALCLCASAVAGQQARRDLNGDPLPAGAIARLGVLRQGGGAPIRAHLGASTLAFSPDGRLVVSSGAHGVHLWDVATGTERGPLQDAPESGALPLRFSADGRTLIGDGRSWLVDTGRLLRPRTLIWQPPFSPWVLSPDGQTVAAADHGRLRVFAADSGEPLDAFQAHKGEVKGLAFSPDSRILASVGEDGKLVVWTEARRRAEETGLPADILERGFPRYRRQVRTIDLRPWREWLSSGADFGAVAFARAGTLLAVRYQPVRARLSLDTSPPAYGPPILYVIDAGAGKEVLRIDSTERGAPTTSYAFSPDGRTLLSSGPGHALWEVKTGKKVLAVDSQGVLVPGAFSADGRRVALVTVPPPPDRQASASALSVHDTTSGAKLFELRGRFDAVALGPDGKVLATSGPDGIRLWDDAGKELMPSGQAPREGHRSAVNAVAFCAEGTVATAGIDETVRTWDAAAGRPLLTLPARESVDHLACSHDGRTLVAATGLAILAWDPASGAELLRLPAGGDALALSPDGKLLATASSGAIRLWEFPGGRPVRELQGRVEGAAGAVEALAFSPDGRRLASALRGSIRLWDVAQGGEVPPTLEARHGIWGLAFLEGGATLASLGDRATVWGLRTGVEESERKGQGYLRFLALSPDGRTAAGADRSAVVLMDLASGEARRLEGHTAPVRALAFSPDGRRVVSGSGDTTALVWSTSPE